LWNKKFEAEDIIKKLEAGESFEKLAQDYSSCGSASQGETLESSVRA
jgi:parvulin-like peptidyl-prolyl isomerase